MSEWLSTVLAEGVVVLWLRRVRGCACRRQPAALAGTPLRNLRGAGTQTAGHPKRATHIAVLLLLYDPANFSVRALSAVANG